MVGDYTRLPRLAADSPRVIFATPAARYDYRDAGRFVIRLIRARARSQLFPNDARQ